MSVTVRVRRELAAGVPDVFARLADKAHWQARVQAAASLSTTLADFTCTPRSVQATTRSTVPLDWLPSAVRGRIGGELAVVRTERWDLAADEQANGILDFDLPAVDATAVGTGSLTPREDGSVIEVAVEIAVPIPLLGGVIEQMVAARVDGLLRADLALLDD